MYEKTYTFIEDLTSDVMFEAFGPTLPLMFEAAAEAMFSVICDMKQIRPEHSIHITVRADDERRLLLDFLNSLLTNSEIEGLFLCSFKIESVEEKNGLVLEASAQGEKISPEKGGTVAKGITYYGFELEKNAEGYRARVALDI